MAETDIVDTDWLADNLESGIALVDVRPPPFYQQAHLPGAVNLPTFYFSGPDGGPASAGNLARRLGALGINRDTHIVAYDDGRSPAAAQLFWLLRYYRHPHVSVLDGGITKWRHEGRDWEYQTVTPEPLTYEIDGPDAEVLATLEDVQRALKEHNVLILDVRSPSEYLGTQERARRNGHIPGAINLEWTNNFDRPDSAVSSLKTPVELRSMYEAAGVTPEKQIIVHCQSGGRSSETYLVLKSLGYPHVANYTAGWEEWGNRTDTPVESP